MVFLHGAGYGAVYDDLRAVGGSSLEVATKAARKGDFATPPLTYPDGAWFTNSDGDCNHACNVASYLALGMLTLQSGFNESCSEVDSTWGWSLCSSGQLEVNDPTLYEIVTNTQYQLPCALPNGIYGDEPETECYAMASCAAGFALLAAFILNV